MSHIFFVPPMNPVGNPHYFIQVRENLFEGGYFGKTLNAFAALLRHPDIAFGNDEVSKAFLALIWALEKSPETQYRQWEQESAEHISNVEKIENLKDILDEMKEAYMAEYCRAEVEMKAAQEEVSGKVMEGD